MIALVSIFGRSKWFGTNGIAGLTWYGNNILTLYNDDFIARTKYGNW